MNETAGRKSAHDSTKNISKKDPSVSKLARDDRPIESIILEKAIHGALPIEYSLVSSNWLSVLWYKEPDLAAVRFTDGSTIYVGDVNRLTRKPYMHGERYKATGAQDFMDSLKGQHVRVQTEPKFVPEREGGGAGTRPLSEAAVREENELQMDAADRSQRRQEGQDFSSIIKGTGDPIDDLLSDSDNLYPTKET